MAMRVSLHNIHYRADATSSCRLLGRGVARTRRSQSTTALVFNPQADALRVIGPTVKAQDFDGRTQMGVPLASSCTVVSMS